MNRNYYSIIALLACSIYSIQLAVPASKWQESRDWVYSAATFHITLAYNNYAPWGQGVCSFHLMLHPFDSKYPKPRVVIGPNNTILSMTDGKKAPFLLSNIPQSPDHFRKIREDYNLKPDALIAVHTLNRRFEQWAVWLATTIKKDGHIKQYQYSTTDFTAPSQIDLIRGVNNIYLRDERNEEAALAHCKAGKGRSGAMAVAYLIGIFMIAEKVNSDGSPYTGNLSNTEIINATIAYAQGKRQVVKINDKQRPALEEFCSNLQQAGSLENLYAVYAEEISKRDAEFQE